MVRLPPSPLPPFSHIKARLFTLDVSKAGPHYPLLPDPFPEGPDYPGMHQPIQGGVRGAPGQAGARGWHPQPHAAPASPVPPRPTETSLRRPPRDGRRWLWRRGCSWPCHGLRAPWGEGQPAGGREPWVPPWHTGTVRSSFIGHAGHAAPGGVSPGTRRQGGTPSCPAEQLGPCGMF